MIWRSEDGISWREVFRRQDVLDPGDASGLAPPNAVAAHGLGFAFVGGDDGVPEGGRIRLFRSPDGHDFRLSQATSPTASLMVARSWNGSGSSAVLVVGDRLFVYARSDEAHLRFESRASDD